MLSILQSVEITKYISVRIHTWALCECYNRSIRIWQGILLEVWYMAIQCSRLHQKTQSECLAITWYHTQHRQWWCPICSYVSQAVKFGEYWMENVILFSRKTRHVFVTHGCPRWQQSQNMAKISVLGACDFSEVWGTNRWTYSLCLVTVSSPKL